jgi:hypothetical protein
MKPGTPIVIVAALLSIFLAPINTSAGETDQDWIYVAKPGDNLWDITTRYLTGIKYWRPLQRMNKIDRPRQIPPGTHIRIPVRWSKVMLANVRIKAVHGAVKIRKAGSNDVIEARAGDVLSQDDAVITPDGASAMLVFADGSELLLVSNSDLRLETLKAYGDGDVADSHVRLQQGQAENRANPKKIPSTRFRITTPSAVMAIRGTDFRVDSSGESSHIEVTQGRINVANNDSDSVLKAGYGMVAKAGKALQKPVPLLTAPDLSAVPDVIETTAKKLDIPEQAGAVDFRVQVAKGRQLDVLLHDSLHPPARIYPDLINLADGDYVMRVRAVDSQGLEGKQSVAEFTLNARPVPPANIYPVTEASIVEKTPEFHWARPEGSSSYQLQVYAGKSETAPLIDEKNLSGERYTADIELPQGVYQWRVQANDEQGQPGPYGHFQSFRVLAEPPTMSDPLLDDKSLTVQWNADDASYRYQFQMSRDKNFSELLVDEKLDASSYVFSDPTPGYYYIRISTIDADGFQGPYSPVQRFEVPPPDRTWVGVLMGLVVLILAL